MTPYEGSWRTHIASFVAVGVVVLAGYLATPWWSGAGLATLAALAGYGWGLFNALDWAKSHGLTPSSVESKKEGKR